MHGLLLRRGNTVLYYMYNNTSPQNIPKIAPALRLIRPKIRPARTLRYQCNLSLQEGEKRRCLYDSWLMRWTSAKPSDQTYALECYTCLVTLYPQGMPRGHVTPRHPVH